MSKIRTCITIEDEVFNKAKGMGINISSFLDIELRRYLALIEGKALNHLSNNQDNRACSLDWIGRQPPKL